MLPNFDVAPTERRYDVLIVDDDIERLQGIHRYVLSNIPSFYYFGDPEQHVNFVWANNAEAALPLMQELFWDEIFLDHDMRHEHKTGAWLIRKALCQVEKPPKMIELGKTKILPTLITVHSMNIAGAQNMTSLLNSYKRLLAKDSMLAIQRASADLIAVRDSEVVSTRLSLLTSLHAQVLTACEKRVHNANNPSNSK